MPLTSTEKSRSYRERKRRLREQAQEEQRRAIAAAVDLRNAVCIAAQEGDPEARLILDTLYQPGEAAETVPVSAVLQQLAARWWHRAAELVAERVRRRNLEPVRSHRVGSSWWRGK